MLIAHYTKLETQLIFEGEVAVNQSCFASARQGQGGRGAAGTVPVFGLLKRGGKVYTTIIPHAKRSTLLTISQERVVTDSIVYSDCWPPYNVLDTSGFKHFRINRAAQKLFSDRKNHINGIEFF